MRSRARRASGVSGRGSSAHSWGLGAWMYSLSPPQAEGSQGCDVQPYSRIWASREEGVEVDGVDMVKVFCVTC